MTYNICYLLIYFCEALIFSYYCNKVFAKRRRIPDHGILLGLYGLLFMFSLLKNPYLNTALFVLINFSYTVFVIKAKWTSALFSTFITTTVMGLSEVITFALSSTMPREILSEQLSVTQVLMLTIISKLVYFLILYIIVHIFYANIKGTNISIFESILLSIVPVLSVVIMLTLISIQDINKISNAIDFLILFSSLSILVINIIIFYLYDYRDQKSKELNEAQLLLQKENDSVEYYKMLLQQDENQKILIHDIKRHFHSLSILISENSFEQANKYIKTLMNLSEFKTSLKYCSNNLLNSIIYKYQRDAESHNIRFSVDIRSNSLDYLNDVDISILFGNLLENALEAASKVSNGNIELNVVNNLTSESTVITMINSCRTNPFNDNSKKLKTTKQDEKRHGFGMRSIKNVISKYNGEFQVYYDEDNKAFHTIILIKSH